MVAYIGKITKKVSHKHINIITQSEKGKKESHRSCASQHAGDIASHK